jgi:predicted CoA-binding protein
MTDERTAIDAFLAAKSFAVVGAGNDMSKYGSKVFAAYLRSGRTPFPVNPNQDVVQGHKAYKSLRDLPSPVEAVSIITPPAVTERVVEDAGAAGVRHLWMQPGAESPRAVARALELGMSVIAGGACFLVVTGYREGAAT